MTSKFDISKSVIFYSEFEQMKNDQSVTGKLTIPASSYTASQAKSFTLTIPVSSSQSLTQVYTNLSTESSIWRNTPYSGGVTIGSSWPIIAFCSINSSMLTIRFVIQNGSASTRTSPEVTINAKVNTFIFQD